jgi:hypothetical protein
VPHVSGSALNVDITIDTAKSDGTAFSVLLVSKAADQNGSGFIGSVAVTVDWASCTLKVCPPVSTCAAMFWWHSLVAALHLYECTNEGCKSIGSLTAPVLWNTCHVVYPELASAATVLQVHQLAHIDKSAYTFDLANATSSVGGRALLTAGEPVHLQVFLDHSALEVRYLLWHSDPAPQAARPAPLQRYHVLLMCPFQTVPRLYTAPTELELTLELLVQAHASCMDCRCFWEAARHCAREHTGACPRMQ